MIDQAVMAEVRARIDALAKPLNSMGQFEEMLARLAGIWKTSDLQPLKGCVLVFCADNGVARAGVCQSPPEVTRLVAQKIADGKGNINALARAANADVLCIDVGMAGRVDHPNMIDKRVGSGTANFAQEAAMSRADAEKAIQAGIDMALDAKARGYTIIATGEVGIGNTTTSAAIAGLLLNLPVAEATGRGAGLSDEGLLTKREVIKRAIALHQPDPRDPIDMLSKLGGFDIAAMCGAFLGGHRAGVPVVIDGVISGVAAMLAAKIEPTSTEIMFASHVSREPAGRKLLDALSLKPVISADLALGEGTGAVMLFPLIDMAMSLYRQNTTLKDLML